MSALDTAVLARVVGGATQRTAQVGVQVGAANLGWSSHSARTDFQDCRDYVARHGQPERDCEGVRGFADRASYPTMADRSVHGAGTPTR